MPPFFAFAMFFVSYVGLASMVWLIAALLALPRRTRSLGKKIAAGMAGSFPGVFLFQIVAAPVVLVGFMAVGTLPSLMCGRRLAERAYCSPSCSSARWWLLLWSRC